MTTEEHEHQHLERLAILAATFSTRAEVNQRWYDTITTTLPDWQAEQVFAIRLELE